MNQNWPLKNSNCCIFKSTHWKQLIFEYVKLEVYRVSWPRGEWAGPTHMGHTPTLKMVLLQYTIGQPVWLLSITVGKLSWENVQDENGQFFSNFPFHCEVAGLAQRLLFYFYQSLCLSLSSSFVWINVFFACFLSKTQIGFVKKASVLCLL